MTYRFTPDARDDLFDAAAYYETQQRGLGAEFSVDVGLGIAKILDAPQRWPTIDVGFRRYRLNRFPYGLIYRLLAGDVVEIVAVFDLRRRPGSWRRN
jgi:plasmid stabilization system protein ParE